MPTNTSALRHDYETQGFMLIPAAIPAHDLDPLIPNIESGVDAHAKSLFSSHKITNLHMDEPFDRRLASLYRDQGSGMRSWDEILEPAALLGLVRSPALLDALEIALGPSFAFSGDFHLRPKLPGETQTSFPWHQDSQYYGAPTRVLQIATAWIPLVDVDERNGCLYVIPGSHRWGLLDGERGADMNIRAFEDVEKRGWPIPVPMKRGVVLIFSNLTFHASKLNVTQTVRWSIDLRYYATHPPERISPEQRDGLRFYLNKLERSGRKALPLRGLHADACAAAAR